MEQLGLGPWQSRKEVHVRPWNEEFWAILTSTATRPTQGGHHCGRQDDCPKEVQVLIPLSHL